MLHPRPAWLSAVLTTLLLAALPAPSPAAGKARHVDLDDPVQRLEAYIRANGDTSGKPVVSHGTGTVYGYVPGEKPRPLFGLEVVGVSRYQKIEGGYLRLHREIGYYTDLATGAVIKRWFNPWLQREVDVIPIQNDPVNRRFTVQESGYRYDASGRT